MLARSLARPLSRSLSAIGVVALFASACASKSSSDEPVIGSASCDNTDEATCVFPFPSDHFRKAGGPYGHAYQLDFGDMLPQNLRSEQRMDPEPFKVHDGFPVFPQIAFTLEGASLDGAPGHDNIAASLEPGSKTLVVDAETGKAVPHFVEYDYLAEDKGAKVIQIRLATRLEHARRYVVLVRGLSGGKPSRGFTALRDGAPTRLAGIDARRAHFDKDVFPVAERLGIPRAELQAAWDFTTTSFDNSTLALRTMRDELYRLVGDEGPEYTITEVQKNPDGPDGFIETLLVGVAKVPSFVLPGEPGGLRRLRLNDKGLPFAEGFEEVPFRVQIPKSVAKTQELASVLQYGHGFLGSDKEANNSWLRSFANDQNALILSADMQGMNTDAGVRWFMNLPADITNLAFIGHEPLQGNMNHLALVRMMKGRFTRDPNVQKAGKPIYDPAALYYHGNSQGGTQGALVMSMSRDISRSMLGVPGVSVAWILARASQWQELAPNIQRNYPDPYDFSAVMSLAAVGWDWGDGTNFAPYLSRNPPPDGTPKSVLLHVALEDAQVNNDVSRVLGRIVGAKQLAPATREVFGLPVVSGPVTDENVYVEFDYGIAPRQKTNRPAATETDTHGHPRKSKKAQAQAFRFFKTGEIRHMCDGVCDPD